jgi:hypothetical protein
MHGHDLRPRASHGARSGRLAPIAAGLLLLIPLALGWLLFFGASERQATPSNPAAPQPAAPAASPAASEPAPAVAAAQASPAAEAELGAESIAAQPRAGLDAPEQRRSAEPAAPPPGQLRVCSADGRPIAGALLSWEALTADDLPRAWTEIALLERFGAADRELSLAKDRQLDGSDADGLAPDRAGQTQFGLLWVTHAEHLPRLAIKPKAGEPGAWAGAELRLEPGRGGLARVRLPAGAERAAFSLVQLALPLAAEGGFNAPERTARYALVRRYGLSDDGSCRLHAFGGPQLLVLLEGERSVALCTLEGDGDVELQPAAPLRLDLRVAAEPGSLPSEPTVRLLAAGPAGPWLPLESVRLDAEGRASVERPWPAGATRLRAELSAERLFAAPIERAVPGPGARLELAFEARAAIAQNVQAIVREGGERRGVPNAQVTWTRLEPPEVLFSFPTLEDGQARFEHLPIGEPLTLEIVAEGFARVLLSPLTLQADQHDLRRTLTLFRSGSLRVRATRDGQPAPIARYAVWLRQAPRSPLRFDAAPDAEGWSLLEGVPQGEGRIVAMEGDLSVSLPAGYQLESAELPLEIEVPLGEPLTGRGVVYSALTGEPLAGVQVAKLQAETNSDQSAEVDPPVRTDAEGRFELGPTFGKTAAARFSIPGYQSIQWTAYLDPRGFHDFGEVYLRQVRRVELRLFGAESGAYQGYDLGLVRPDQGDYHWTGFSPEGLASVPLRQAAAEFMLYAADDSRDYAVSTVRGGDQRVELEERPGEPLTVEFVDVSGEPVEATGVLGTGFFTGGYSWMRSLGITKPTSTVRFRQPPRGTEYLLQLSNGPLGGSVSLRSAEGPASARIVLAEDPPRLRLLDGQREPVAGVSVVVYPLGPDGRPVSLLTLASDAAGQVPLELALDVPVLVQVNGRDSSIQTYEPIGPRQPGQVIELEFRPEHALFIRLLDGQTPLGGVQCELYAPPTRWTHSVGFSQQSRQLEIHNLGAGRYRFEAAAPGRFPIKRELDLPVEPLELQLRRVADLELRLLAADGSPLADLRPRLESLEGLGELESWIAGGLLEDPGRSDGLGRLALRGLPHGRYRAELQVGGRLGRLDLTLEPGQSHSQVLLLAD